MHHLWCTFVSLFTENTRFTFKFYQCIIRCYAASNNFCVFRQEYGYINNLFIGFQIKNNYYIIFCVLFVHANLKKYKTALQNTQPNGLTDFYVHGSCFSDDNDTVFEFIVWPRILIKHGFHCKTYSRWEDDFLKNGFIELVQMSCKGLI